MNEAQLNAAFNFDSRRSFLAITSDYVDTFPSDHALEDRSYPLLRAENLARCSQDETYKPGN